MTISQSTADWSSPGKDALTEDPWWRGAVTYQVYPRSFRDSNGDGVGDLKGCIEGLDHIASLGVDAIWLSPFFTSPMDDFGYDVADYEDVDPLFGTLGDFDELIEKAHAKNIKIIIDQVYSHTSDQHPWFIESRKDKTNPKADWYVWVDPKPDGSPPTNWQSVFGGASWEWDNNRRQYYLHNFLTSQPDLNLHNEEVQEALLAVAKFWLDKGVDGFRLDAINFGMHDLELRDNPPARVFQRPPTRPFDFQHHKYSMSHADIPFFLERIRDLMDQYDGRFTVAEVGGPDPLEEMKSFVADGRLNSAYSFEYLYADDISGELVKKNNLDWPEGDGWPSWAFSNHDAPRCVSRWAQGRDSKSFAKCLMMLMLAQRGNVFIYQGEELGLEQAHVPFEKLQDPEAIKNWPETLGRDGARTPMPWTSAEPNAGFSDQEPWLPVDPRHLPDAVSAQENDPNSMLNFTRQLVQLRGNSPALRLGSVDFIDAPDGLLVFERTENEIRMICVFNLSHQDVTFTPSGNYGLNFATGLKGVKDGPASGDVPSVIPVGAGYIATAT